MFESLRVRSLNIPPTTQKLLLAVGGPELERQAAQAQHTQQPSMGTAAKAVKTVMPRPAKHWVGNGFNVYPVFAHMAFTKALSPWLMFDYAAPQQVS